MRIFTIFKVNLRDTTLIEPHAATVDVDIVAEK